MYFESHRGKVVRAWADGRVNDEGVMIGEFLASEVPNVAVRATQNSQPKAGTHANGYNKLI